jgi:hypothetical protein
MATSGNISEALQSKNLIYTILSNLFKEQILTHLENVIIKDKIIQAFPYLRISVKETKKSKRTELFLVIG